MTEFTSILTHGRRLQGAIKDLSTAEIISVAEKLNAIIAKREEQAALQAEAAKEKLAKLEAIRQQMEEAGLDINDLIDEQPVKKSKRAGQKRPVKYTITDENGEETRWTGIGRMPKVYAAALAAGKSLTDFSV